MMIVQSYLSLPQGSIFRLSIIINGFEFLNGHKLRYSIIIPFLDQPNMLLLVYLNQFPLYPHVLSYFLLLIKMPYPNFCCL